MDGISNVMERLAQLSRDIGPLEMLIREELLEMPDQKFWDTVCRGVIGHTPEEVPEGTHLFQCSWNNRQLFNDRNEDAEYMRTHQGKHKYMIANDPGVPERRREPHPEVMVNIAGLARFSMTCPCGELEKCPRRNAQFARDDARRESMREPETERMR